MERFTILEKLGEGCFGTVHAAVSETGHPVAIKKIPITRTSEGLPNSAVRELLAMQHVAHENVLQLYEVFPAGSSLALVMERGARDLASVLASHSALAPLPLPYVKTWLRMALSALASCHATRILHRDVKVSNFILTRENILKLGDFGLARVWDPSGAEPMTHEVATRWYRAPELLFGERHYGPAVDVWGLGCVFVELLHGHSGAVAFPGEGDIDQITKIFRVLGTPTEESWPGVGSLPDWGKIRFNAFEPAGLASRLPMYGDRVDAAALDLLGRMLALNPRNRITAAEALQHAFFVVPPIPAAPGAIVLPAPPERLPSLAQVISGDAQRMRPWPLSHGAAQRWVAGELHAAFPSLAPFTAPPSQSTGAAAAAAAVREGERGGGGGGHAGRREADGRGDGDRDSGGNGGGYSGRLPHGAAGDSPRQRSGQPTHLGRQALAAQDGAAPSVDPSSCSTTSSRCSSPSAAPSAPPRAARGGLDTQR